MSELEGRVFLITGANTGIGRVTARELARRGGRVYLTARNLERAQDVLDEIKSAGGDAHFLPLELGSLTSVKACAQAFLATGDPLHVLVNNAGVAAHRGQTEEGFELQFGVNHLAHFVLTQLLLDKLRESAPSRIVVVSSKGHKRAKAVDYDVERYTKSFAGIAEYFSSKLANILFASELARRLEGTGVHTYSLHPGVIKSDAWRRMPWPLRAIYTRKMLTVEEGAATTLYCATSPEVADDTGLYYDGCAVARTNAAGQNQAAARELWERSEKFVAPYL